MTLRMQLLDWIILTKVLQNVSFAIEHRLNMGFVLYWVCFEIYSITAEVMQSFHSAWHCHVYELKSNHIVGDLLRLRDFVPIITATFVECGLFINQVNRMVIRGGLYEIMQW